MEFTQLNSHQALNLEPVLLPELYGYGSMLSTETCTRCASRCTRSVGNIFDSVFLLRHVNAHLAHLHHVHQVVGEGGRGQAVLGHSCGQAKGYQCAGEDPQATAADQHAELQSLPKNEGDGAADA